ncbi:MAG TPA: hypothetical protein VM536_02355, partial [Chloroflexia bacterium]|nr:hypothetical protein [Chloroflexia bacterium]
PAAHPPAAAAGTAAATAASEGATAVTTPHPAVSEPATAVSEAATAAPAVTTAISAAATAAPSSPTAACPKLNLNTVTADQLLAVIPGFSARMTREFSEYKPYASILQFRREIGKYVNADQVAEYEKYVYVPIDPNESDAATLQQLPGVSSEVATVLIAGRPYATAAAFTQAVAARVPSAQASSVACYLAAP